MHCFVEIIKQQGGSFDGENQICQIVRQCLTLHCQKSKRVVSTTGDDTCIIASEPPEHTAQSGTLAPIRLDMQQWTVTAIGKFSIFNPIMPEISEKAVKR